MAGANENGVRWRDIERLDQQDRVLQESQKWLSEMGSKHNEQIKAHDRRLDDIEEKAMRVPLIEADQQRVLQALNRARTAGWAAAGSLLVLAAAVVTQGPS